MDIWLIDHYTNPPQDLGMHGNSVMPARLMRLGHTASSYSVQLQPPNTQSLSRGTYLLLEEPDL